MLKLILPFWPVLLVESYIVFEKPSLLVGQLVFVILSAIGSYAVLYAIEHNFLKKHKLLTVMLVLAFAVSSI